MDEEPENIEEEEEEEEEWTDEDKAFYADPFNCMYYP